MFHSYAIFCGCSGDKAAMAVHRIEPTPETTHGQFSPNFQPALTVDPGDVVHIHTLDVTWGLENHVAVGRSRAKLARPPGDPRYDGPALTGPIAVRGAEPGMTLRVDIIDVRLSPWGWTFAGGPGVFNKRLNNALGISDSPSELITWQVVQEEDGRGSAINQMGHSVRLLPFAGTMGLAPAAPGLHSGWTPGWTGGNMDCKELTAGSTLFLPVATQGGLLSAGDGHACQGDGEVGGMAIECRMAPLTVRLDLVSDMPIRSPHIRTRDAWVVLGFGEDLEAATHMALDGATTLVERRLAVSRAVAFALAGVAVDLRITQIVNGAYGVHAVLRDGALEVS